MNDLIDPDCNCRTCEFLRRQDPYNDCEDE